MNGDRRRGCRLATPARGIAGLPANAAGGRVWVLLHMSGGDPAARAAAGQGRGRRLSGRSGRRGRATLATRNPAPSARRRRRRFMLLGAALLGAGWLAASPPAPAQTRETGATTLPDAGLLMVHAAILAGLQKMPELHPRAIGALALGGRCSAATPCRAEGAPVISTMPPLQVSAIACEVALEFDGRTLVAASVEGLGRGASCETARRDAPMQVAARLLPVLRADVLDWSRKRRLEELAGTLEALESGAARIAPPGAVAGAPRKAMKAMDEMVRELDSE